MKEIYVLTTKNCFNCNVMETTMIQATKTMKEVECKVVDFKDAPEDIKSKLPMSDYPLTVFVEDGEIKYMFTGTKSTLDINNILNNLEFNK